jgi:hypothetical protein
MSAFGGKADIAAKLLTRDEGRRNRGQLCSGSRLIMKKLPSGPKKLSALVGQKSCWAQAGVLSPMMRRDGLLQQRCTRATLVTQ